MKKLALILCSILAAGVLPAHAQFARSTYLSGPAGSGSFGKSVTYLTDGSFVVTDPDYDQPSPAVANVGAVYYFAADGTLINTLKGSTANDQVGYDGIVVLANGNFLVRSSKWNNGAATSAGAVTLGLLKYGFGSLGSVNTVGSFNSIVGSSSNDVVGSGPIAVLPNGAYVVGCPHWRNNGVVDAGAAVFGYPTGMTGAIDSTKALVGESTSDQVGDAIAVLTNGHYVVASRFWSNPATGASEAGAVTWGSHVSGVTGTINSTKALVGSNVGDHVGRILVNLPDGNFLAFSRDWNGMGAMTWCKGDGSTLGEVSAVNSLVGGEAGDFSGSFVTVLSTGHYVLAAPLWNLPGNTDNGAVVWCNRDGSTVGQILSNKPLYGAQSDDRVGTSLCVLTNGHYVVCSPNWNNVSIVDAGAATWCSGTGNAAPVTPTAMNSLVGTTASDFVGFRGATALTNGNYVVSSETWHNGAVVSAGAATWGNGTTGIKGAVSAANSLVGSTAFDRVGVNINALRNGNYVVRSVNWDNTAAGATDAGAVTWGNGASGVKGTISAANSLVGTTSDDQVGTYLTALNNGNYVTGTPFWNNVGSSATDAGAATWGNGATGIKGAVSPLNSLVGTTTNDKIAGNGIVELTNGNYVVTSPGWTNTVTGAANAGAFTWGSGLAGPVGAVSTSNSLVGVAAGDGLGNFFALGLPDGGYVAWAAKADRNSYMDNGVLAVCNGETGNYGHITEFCSVAGGASSEGDRLSRAYDAVRKQFIVGLPLSNTIVILGGQNAIRSIAKSGGDAPGAADLSFSTLGAAVIDDARGVHADYTLSGAGSTAGRNKGLFAASADHEDTDLVLQTGTAISALGFTLPSNAKATAISSVSANSYQGALFQATISGTGVSTANNRLLLLDRGDSVNGLLRTGQPVGVGSLATASVSAINEVLQPYVAQSLAALRYTLAANAITPVSSASDSGFLFIDNRGFTSSVMTAREGSGAFGGGGTFGQFGTKAAFMTSAGLFFTASFKPAIGTAVDAVFSMTPDGVGSARLAQAGATMPNGGGAAYSAFLGIGAFGPDAVVHCTLKNCPPISNEAIVRLPGNVIVARKGDAVDAVNLPGVTFAKFNRFWACGFGVVMHCTLGGTGVTAVNNQALILKQSNGANLVLLRTGQTASGISPATLTTISAVDVGYSGGYAVLGTVSGSAGTNQALWTGSISMGDDNAQRVLRLPSLVLRKGQTYTTTRTPRSTVRSIALKPVAEASTSALRGLGSTVGMFGYVTVEITGDRSQKELVVLTPFNFLD